MRLTPRPRRAPSPPSPARTEHPAAGALPRHVADAIAAFVLDRCRSGSWALDEQQSAARAGQADVVLRYRDAVRDGHELTADNLAHALLDIAATYGHHARFDRAWLHWQQIVAGLEERVGPGAGGRGAPPAG
ncbi:hypothetical protein [Kineococcus gypseus]|uniref:hypothetical protein n=1 Tax=Kineococcus gypseus TaxID=1637102 RepID=UPI003D7E7BEE